jgi:uncharacterized protein YuzE
MLIRYDQDADVAAFDLVRGAQIARTTQIDAGTLVDCDASGAVVSIEVIQPAHPWPLEEILARFDISAEHRAILTWVRQGWYPGALEMTASAAPMLVPA